ncbi:MAG TPA: patatin-like phospholipase family protein [Phycisphaerales bacterium]|nr:patatin-like phospholipase family protein [Phycisphaerales bacterium]
MKELKKINRLHKNKVLIFAMFIVFSCMAGCSLQRNPVPIAQMPNAELISIKKVRTWGGQFSPHFQKDLVESIRQERQGDFPLKPDGSTSYSALAISGGGSNGAFGAGFLCGWTQAGTRPKFKLVTGISTGALIAPFAFLGPEYDKELEKVYTTITKKNIFEVRSIVSLLWEESFAETDSLKRLIEQNIDQDLMDAIAAEHARGKRLYIGTTNLDAQRFVVWNMGAIANSGHPDAIELFSKVMLASASIPGAFPPVYFDVEAVGKRYDEMHVDGGTIAGVFFHGFTLDLPAARKEVFGDKAPEPGGAIYIIRNGKIAANPEQVPRNLVKIIPRALATLTRSQGWGDLYRVYVITKRSQIDFNYVGIPDDDVATSKEAFDQTEMNRLFDLGFEIAKSGYKWHKVPPGLDNSP